jgi:hypothetical protein
MYRFPRPAMVLALPLVAFGALAPHIATAQSAMTAAQCEALLVLGPQRADPAAFSACMPYYSALAQGAAAPGTFSVIQPRANVTASTSGTGG